MLLAIKILKLTIIVKVINRSSAIGRVFFCGAFLSFDVSDSGVVDVQIVWTGTRHFTCLPGVRLHWIGFTNTYVLTMNSLTASALDQCVSYFIDIGPVHI